jgi:hypothetical protein
MCDKLRKLREPLNLHLKDNERLIHFWRGIFITSLRLTFHFYIFSLLKATNGWLSIKTFNRETLTQNFNAKPRTLRVNKLERRRRKIAYKRCHSKSRFDFKKIDIDSVVSNHPSKDLWSKTFMRQNWKMQSLKSVSHELLKRLT